MSIGKRIKELRKEQNLTMKQLADALELQVPSISRYEKDEYHPSADAIIALSQFFGVSADWLLTGQSYEGTKQALLAEGAQRIPAINGNEGPLLTEGSPKPLLIQRQNLLQDFDKLPYAYQQRTLERVSALLELSQIQPSIATVQKEAKPGGIPQAWENEADLQIAEDAPFYFPISSSKPPFQRSFQPPYETEIWGFVNQEGRVCQTWHQKRTLAPVPCDFALAIDDPALAARFRNVSIIYMRNRNTPPGEGGLALIQAGTRLPSTYLRQVHFQPDETCRLVSAFFAFPDITLPAGEVRFLAEVVGSNSLPDKDE